MDDPGTEALRQLAPCWSLAGDERLLSILQNTHQRLLAKCEEANNQLQKMAMALNDANISLQNVNNQFMALSSSQFIESRVYDDDDTPEVPVVKEPPKPEIPDELTSLKRSVSVLEQAHEVITILHDSDTESDTDDDMIARMVLKPKDVYADRPLPYIIGSQPWKNKWHAGLVIEDSDTDSSTSKLERESDQYSHSEPDEPHAHTDRLRVSDTHDTTVSETSSELPSEQAIHIPSNSIPKPTPSDVASEIARRLGARDPPKMVERVPEYEEPAKPTVRKIYRPQDPVTSTIFPDEPPPLSEHSDAESDIFADLHRTQPYARSQLTDDLFGFNNENNYENNDNEADIFSDFAIKPATDPSAKPTSLFDAGPTPHMFDKLKTSHQPLPDRSREHTYDTPKASNGGESNTDTELDRDVKKPVGGISLFGNKGTESIGAAILKRNLRKSSTSGDDNGSEARPELTHTDQQIRKEKNIFDDLFARSETKKATKDNVDFAKQIKTEIKKKNEVKLKEKQVDKPKVDLFSDNLFDDIDDIFSTNVVKIPPKDNAKSKSIFEDDDDLFSEIAAPKTVKIVATSSNNKKGLFDSDDELFSNNITKPKLEEKPKICENITKVDETIKITENSTKISESPKITKETTKSIFDDDEDDIFSTVKITNQLNEVTNVKTTPASPEKYYDLSKGDEQTSKNLDSPKPTNIFKSPSLFDGDNGESNNGKSNIFAEPTKSPNINNSAIHTEASIKTEVTPGSENLDENIDVIPQKPVITDDHEQSLANNDTNLNKDIITIEDNVNKMVDDTLKSNNYVLNVRENVDRKYSNTVEEIGTAPKIFDHINKNIMNVEQSSSDTNDDYSDQDFGDLPPKVQETNKSLNINTNLVTEAEHNKEKIDKQNIFDNTTLKEDIFAKSNEEDKKNSDAVFTSPVPVFTETITREFEKTKNDNKPNQSLPKTIEADIFSDILSEPPAFEKPKEPKRSKNVNALFDDDSDDESLFFKKNDIISDEKPEDFKPTQDRLFGLFTDEPPDDGFSKISDDLDDDIFSTLPKPKIPQNENLPSLPNTEEFDIIPVPKTEPKLLDVEKIDNDEDIFRTLPKSNLILPTETPKALVIDNVHKVVTANTENQDSGKTVSDDEELFNIPKSETNISLPNKPLDILKEGKDLFTSVPKVEKPSAPTLQVKEKISSSENKNQESINKTSDDELFKTAEKPEIPRLKKETVKQKSDEDIFKISQSKSDSVPNSELKQTTIETRSDAKPEKSEPRKVGKLKVDLNINVNALLPGASPKKVPPPKPNDQTDGQTQSVAENTNTEPKILESQNHDSKLLKSVSFDGKPESEVLDNTLSKERAKIQVKRRPSTRKARREAVRKSAVDFGEDSTDNSSSIDDPPRIQPEKQYEAVKKDDVEDSASKNVQSKTVHLNTQAQYVKNSNILAKIGDTNIESKIESRNVDKETIIRPEKVGSVHKTTEKPTFPKDVKSKVVYILHDEDIFNTSSIENRKNNVTPDTSVKSKTAARNVDSSTGIATLGKVYDRAVTKSDTGIKKDTKTSLFGEDDDEEIFKGKTVVQKTSIFDSDSEEDLFGTSKKEVEKKEIEIKKEIKREVVKGSLFGDEDDDDDLFGVKMKKKVEPKPQPSTSTAKNTPKSTEPVFEDPLSMFGDDD